MGVLAVTEYPPLLTALPLVTTPLFFSSNSHLCENYPPRPFPFNSLLLYHRAGKSNCHLMTITAAHNIGPRRAPLVLAGEVMLPETAGLGDKSCLKSIPLATQRGDGCPIPGDMQGQAGCNLTRL